MAVSITKVADWTGDTSNTSSYVSPSFTPTTGRKLYVACHVTGTADGAPGLTASTGLTFTRRVVAARSSDLLNLFESDGPVTSGGSQTLTLNLPSDPGTGIIGIIWDADGIVNQASTTTSILHTGGTATQTTGTPPSCTLNGTPLTTSGIIAATDNAISPPNQTAPTGLTEDIDAGFATPTTGFEAAHANSGITSATVTWGNNSGSTSACFAAEIGIATGASLSADVTLSGTGTVTPAAVATRPGAATLTATGTATAASVLSTTGASSVTVNAPVTADMAVTRPATAAATGTGTITAAGTLDVRPASTVTATATVTAAASVETPGSDVDADASLTATAARTVAAAVSRPSAATVSAAASVTAEASVTRPTLAALTATATVQAAADLTRVIAGTITTTATITAAATVSNPLTDRDITVTAELGAPRWNASLPTASRSSDLTSKRWSAELV